MVGNRTVLILHSYFHILLLFPWSLLQGSAPEIWELSWKQEDWKKKRHNWVRKASKWFKRVRWIRKMNHREIINWILKVEFTFNHFVKCLLLFECFEPPNRKSLLLQHISSHVYFTYKISVQLFMQDRGTIALWLSKSASAITQQQLF